MSDPEIQLREQIQRLQNRVGELEAALKATRTAVTAVGETAIKAIERLAEVEPLIEAAWRFTRHDIALWELEHHALLIGRDEIARRNKLT